MYVRVYLLMDLTRELPTISCLLKIDLGLLILSYFFSYFIDFYPMPEAWVTTLSLLASKKKTDLQPKQVQFTTPYPKPHPRSDFGWSWPCAAFGSGRGPLYLAGLWGEAPLYCDSDWGIEGGVDEDWG